nr:indolepyruvate ferredoxin oxidoreductase family protein [Thiolinea sp.]
YTHMGGEGVTWLGMAPFTDEKHVFTNLGDGTYFHSGILAIRQSVAAGVNITYKLLFNSAVAMTGGQPVDGPLTIPMLAQQLAAEGVAAIRLVTDDPQRYRGVGLADGVQVFHRECLDQVQRELRDIPGCTILVYDQTCATENRRQRKRGLAPDPDRRAFINPLVCEGCGDCSVQSNCIALEPLETPFGRKRRINQSACNKDFSCINGFCPAFVTLEGVVPRKAALPELRQQALPEPHRHPLDQPCNIAITGIGGTGVLTIGALIGMAAHIEGKSVILQDFSGLAQKGGAVVSHVRVSRADQPLHAPQIAAGEADLLLAADTVVAASTASINLYRDGRTRAILNTRLSPVSGFVFQRDFDFREQQVLDAIRAHVHPEVAQLDFGHLSERVCGDAIATTVMLLGYACQQGLLPVGPEALLQAIVLNGVAPDLNRRAFTWGRVFAEYPQQAAERLADAKPGSGLHSGVAGGLEGCATLAELMQQHETFLKAYQNQALADRYRSLVQQVQATETAVTRNDRLTRTVARQYFRLLAYKDEYEVARLYTSGEFENYLSSQFEGNLRTTFHLAPGWLAGRSLPNGRPRKRALGHWMFTAMKLLARMRFLRGTPLDPFGYQQERQLERGLPAQYEQAIGILCQHLNAGNFKEAQAVADYTDDIRGFGPVKMAGIKTAEKRYEAALQAFLRTA